jgi:anti-anti-sigma factor
VDEKPYVSSYDAAQKVLFVSGTVDELAGPAFREDIEKHSQQYSRSLTVDLSAVDFFPSLAVGVLAVAMRNSKESGQELETRAREGSIVARVLTVCALPYTPLPAAEQA